MLLILSFLWGFDGLLRILNPQKKMIPFLAGLARSKLTNSRLGLLTRNFWRLLYARPQRPPKVAYWDVQIYAEIRLTASRQSGQQGKVYAHHVGDVAYIPPPGA